MTVEVHPTSNGNNATPINRRILITGASRGFGAAVAQALAAPDTQLILTARTVGGLEEVDDKVTKATGRAATLVPLDLTDVEKVDQLGPALHARFGHIDTLVHAAATLGPLTPLGHCDAADWDQVIAVNLTATFRLLRTLDPLLRHAPAGRAIFVTDRIHSLSPPYWGAYAASKAGLEALVAGWASEVRKTGTRAHLVAPGPMATRLRATAFPGEPEGKAADPADIAERLAARIAADDLPTDGILDLNA